MEIKLRAINVMWISIIHQRLSEGGPESLKTFDLVVIGVLILLALELLNILVQFLSRRSKLIPVRGKHLDVLSFVSTEYCIILFCTHKQVATKIEIYCSPPLHPPPSHLLSSMEYNVLTSCLERLDVHCNQ
jgi:hypothetical protein